MTTGFAQFSDLKVQSDPTVDDKVKGNLLLLTSSILLLPSYFLHQTSSFLLLTSDIILLTSYIFHLPSSFFHLTSYFFHLTSFRTSPVPFNLEGAPPLSCILPPQEEENRSACRSYIKVSADHQRSGFFCALRQGETQKILIFFVIRGICTNFVRI